MSALACACLLVGCSSDRAGGPTAPPDPRVPIDPIVGATLRMHVDDPMFQQWLPGYLGSQDDARLIHSLARVISEDLSSGDAEIVRRSLAAMSEAIQEYRVHPGHAPRDETVLRAIEICVQEILAILDGDRRSSSSASPALLEDRG